MFACVHHVFGAANVGNVIKSLSDPQLRKLAVNTLVYQAEARVRDPTYGVVGHIMELEQRHRKVQEDLMRAKAQLAQYLGPEGMRKEFSLCLGASSKGKNKCDETPEPHMSSFRRLCTDSDVEMWDPFPPWETFDDTQSGEKLSSDLGENNVGSSSLQGHGDKKGKRPADFPSTPA
uniref:LOB domain-containing protein 36 n=2 Tax=Cajanus cajan TaxID=3821 RepID=A0A151RZR9_CAJCA|nr:LOB domain-containing protein 36 [Cajanus cajan]